MNLIIISCCGGEKGNFKITFTTSDAKECYATFIRSALFRCVCVWPPFLQLAATNIQGKCQFLCCICSLKHQSKPTQLQSNAIAKIFTHFERPTIENPSRPSSSDVSLIGTGVRPCLPPGLGSAVAASRIFF